MRYLKSIIVAVVLLMPWIASAELPWVEHGTLEVSTNGRFLQHADGTPFFWQGDTAWGIFRNSLRDADNSLYQDFPIEDYFATRAAQGFNVVQAQLLPLTLYRAHTVEGTFAKDDVDTEVNAYGHKAFVDGNTSGDFSVPLIAKDSTSAIDDYWEYVEYVIDTAAKHGIYMAIVPAWNNHFKNHNVPTVVTDKSVAYGYGHFLGKRFGIKPNVVWIMGGDAFVKPEQIEDNAFRLNLLAMNFAIAEGIADGVNGVSEQDGEADYDTTLMTLHPKGAGQSSGDLKEYRQAKWLDFNAIQSSITHDRLSNKGSSRIYDSIQEDYMRSPVRPVLNSEVSYENSWRRFKLSADMNNVDTIPITSWESRRSGYLSVFAGSFGHTYGHRNIIHFLRGGQIAGNGANGPWYESLGIDLVTGERITGLQHGEGANHMQYLKNLILSRPFFERIPDQAVIGKTPEGGRFDRLQATRSDKGNYALVYVANGRDFEVDFKQLHIKHLNAWWYNPRDGQVYDGKGQLTNNKPFVEYLDISKLKKMNFLPPGKPSPASDDPFIEEFKVNSVGNDWVLVLDDADAGFSVPGVFECVNAH